VHFIVARSRAVNNVPQIFVLNLFLGWTLLGWVFALIWAVRPVQKKEFVPSSARSSLKACPKCDFSSQPEALFCMKCGSAFS